MKSQTTLNHQRAELKRKLFESVLATAVCVAISLTFFAVAVTTYSDTHPQMAVVCGVGCVAFLAVVVWFIAEAVDRACKLDSREFNRR